MRFILLLISAVFCLSGCIQYSGIRAHSQLYPDSIVTDSSQPLTHITTKPDDLRTSHWWSCFRDPELDQLIQQALTGSPTVKTAEARVRQARALVTASQSTLWPRLGGQSSFGREHFTGDGLVPPPFNGLTANEALLALNFEYDFDFWGKNRHALAAAINEEQALRADQAAAELLIASAVAANYFELQSLQAQLTLAGNLLNTQQSSANIVIIRQQHHIESLIPVNTAHAEISSNRDSVLRLQNAIELSQHQLAVLIGLNPTAAVQGIAPFAYQPEHINLPKAIYANLLTRRPDIIAARLRTEAEAVRVNVVKASFFPDINLMGFLSYQSLGFSNLIKTLSRDNKVSSVIDLPIFDANQRRANLKSQYASYDIAVNQYNETILSALHQVADALSALSSLQARISVQQHAVDVTQQNLQLLTMRYHRGMNAYTPVLDKKLIFLQQQQQLLQLQTQHIQSAIQLMHALGGDYSVNGGENGNRT